MLPTIFFEFNYVNQRGNFGRNVTIHRYIEININKIRNKKHNKANILLLPVLTSFKTLFTYISRLAVFNK